jgi:S1-C subfamily serine protease
MTADPSTPSKHPRVWRITPAVGAIALVAAIGGGAIAAVALESVYRGGSSPTADAVVTPRASDLAQTEAAGSHPLSSEGTASHAVAIAPSKQRSLENIYKADAPGVVSVIATIKGGEALGSGIVLDTEGYILTNEHVIAGQHGVRISFSNSDNVKAKVIGSDASTDLAVLKVDLPASALHPLPLGDSATVEAGDSVVAIGNPFGLDRTLTAGIISAVHRQISAPNKFAIDDALQTDAAINHGNSGGPLIDRSGAVIGINAQLPSNSQVNGNVGVGFAIPIDIAKTVIPQLKAHGHVSHPWLGLEGDTIDSSLASATHVPAKQGVLIEAIVPGSPIAKAGIVSGDSSMIVNGMGYCLGGDVITSVDGVALTSVLALREVIADHAPGDTLSLHVVHENGTSKDYDVKLGTQPQSAPNATSGCASKTPSP